MKNDDDSIMPATGIYRTIHEFPMMTGVVAFVIGAAILQMAVLWTTFWMASFDHGWIKGFERGMAKRIKVKDNPEFSLPPGPGRGFLKITPPPLPGPDDEEILEPPSRKTAPPSIDERRSP